MAHEHSHGHSGHSHDHGVGGAHVHGSTDKRRVLVAALLTGGFMIAEAVGGWLTGSLALAVPCLLSTKIPAATSATTTTTAAAEPIRMTGRRELFGFGIGIGYAAAGAPQGSA